MAKNRPKPRKIYEPPLPTPTAAPKLIQLFLWRDKMMGLADNGAILEITPDQKFWDSTQEGGLHFRVVAVGIPAYVR